MCEDCRESRSQSAENHLKMGPRNIVTAITNSAAFARCIDSAERFDRGRPAVLRVLTYHRVDYPEARPLLAPSLLSATPAAFEQQMRHLDAQYHVVSMDTVLESFRRGTALPARAVLITFDDAYCDFAEHAWPILKRYGLPVTLFVPTAYPNQPASTFWWDRLYQALACSDRRNPLETQAGRLALETQEQRRQTFKRMREYVKSLPHDTAMAWVAQICSELGASPPSHHVLGWSTLRELAREGVTLAPHTRTHPMINRISSERVRTEVAGSIQDLAYEVGSAVPVFAYPSGGVNERVVRIIADEGIELAFTTVRGLNDVQHAHPLRLRRINVGQATTMALFRAQLLPWMIFLNSVPFLP